MKRLLSLKIFLLLTPILCFGISPAWGAKPGAKIYVNASATGYQDGTSWATAFNDLQDALDEALSGNEIWVAAGTYKPTTSSDRSISFILKSGVKIYGGFAGLEKNLRKRSLDPSLTVLSGDIGSVGDDTDNSYHVVYAEGVTDAVLDGFTVTRGYGDTHSSKGAGMYTSNSALTVSRCIFSQNKVAVKGVYGALGYGLGGGMYNENSAVIVTNCTFSENQAGNAPWNKIGAGGGMYNKGYFGTGSESLQPVITGCTFSDNVASSKWDPQQGGGGGMYNYECSPAIDRCTFGRNLGGYGGAMLNYSLNSLALPTITNCIFNTNSNNYSDGLGGAIYNYARATILNCTFYQNGWRLFPEDYPSRPRFRPSTSSGGAVYDDRGGSTIFNCIFSNNVVRNDGGAVFTPVGRWRTTVINSLFYENTSWQGYYYNPIYEVISNFFGDLHPDSVDNLYDIDPLLMDPAGGDFHLRYDSPCIDSGYALTFGYLPSTYPIGTPATDFEGDNRIVDSDGDGMRLIDIGADEVIPNLIDLRAFLEDLADSGALDETTAVRLLGYVDDAQAALDLDQEQTAIDFLIELVDEARELVEDETARLIERMTFAVIGEI